MLQALSRDKVRITEKIMKLGMNPNDPTLDVKPLHGHLYYRLRVGNWRVIYALDEDIKIITIEKVKARRGAYK